jgi:hypothetical protein
VGGPQRATAIRLFKAHVLGRARSRHSPRGQALLPCPRDRGLKVRDEIYEDIVSKGWNEKRQAFLQHYGSASLDAANLMMALTFFLAPTDPRMLATLDATLLPLEKGGLTANGLVYRYNIKEAGDGAIRRGRHSISARLACRGADPSRSPRPVAARGSETDFRATLGFANHVGLYAEGTGHRGDACE